MLKIKNDNLAPTRNVLLDFVKERPTKLHIIDVF